MRLLKHMRRQGVEAAFLGAVVLLAACGSERDETLIHSPVGPVPEASQRAGDPNRGYQALVNQPYIRCGLPYSAYRQIRSPVPTEQLLDGRPGRTAELPYYLTAYSTPGGVDLVVDNCLACHAAEFNGRLIVGLGNESLDFTEDVSLRAEAAGAYVEDPAEAHEWRRWADRLGTLRPYMMTDTIGVNPAISVTLALLAHRDPVTLAWSEQPLFELPPIPPPPTSVPPWWRMKKKHALFYNSEGRGDHARLMMLGALICAEDVETVRAIDSYAPDIHAYLATLEPPAWPFPIDHGLAGRGKQVFQRSCAACHGTYGDQPSYPNLVVDLATIGTDPVIARFFTDGEADRFTRWISRSFYGELAVSAPAPGYYAPPLDGVWATAPYLHNGSVPTIEALLDSRKRPVFWSRSFRSNDYDERALGWRYQSLPYGKKGARDHKERSRIYDTTLPGYSRDGHTFGDALNEDDRRAILEYLKTL